MVEKQTDRSFSDGVVIGETAIIGERVRIYQRVTPAARKFPADEVGALLKKLPRDPIVEVDVVIYAGATILGRIAIGRGSEIGGNVWVTTSVPPESGVSQAEAENAVTPLAHRRSGAVQDDA